MELRQLRYVVTLAEELHFGRAAAREHIVQSALSQHIRRLEREIGATLFVSNTHRVVLTPAGEAFLSQARRVLTRVDLAVAAARDARSPTLALRAAVGDASLDSMRQILGLLQNRRPGLEIRQVEAGVPAQCGLLAADRLDIGFGRASQLPDEITSELIRLDPMGVAVAATHPCADLPELSTGRLASETVLLAEADRSPEYNSFVLEQCRTAGFLPTLYRGTVQSLRGAADLVARGRCVMVLPSSCSLPPGVAWIPLIEPTAQYPFSLLWWCQDPGELVQAVRVVARTLARSLAWLSSVKQEEGAETSEADSVFSQMPQS